MHFESEAGEKWSVVADGGLFDSGELVPAGGFSVAPSVPATHDANVRILGGLSETGMLVVEAAGSSGESGSRFASLGSALASLRTSPGVAYAAMSTVQETKAVPRRADGATAGSGNGWDWDDPFTKGNWGLVWSQFPEAWNLLESLRRKQPKVITGIVDGGFEEHPDLPGLQVLPQVCRAGGQDCLPLQNRPDLHGNHVAGIIGAAYDNELEGAPSRSQGVSGANPVARHGYPMQDAGIDPQRPLRAAMLADQQLQLFARSGQSPSTKQSTAATGTASSRASASARRMASACASTPSTSSSAHGHRRSDAQSEAQVDATALDGDATAVSLGVEHGHARGADGDVVDVALPIGIRRS